MAIETTIRCDVCRVQKQRSNHWYRVAIQGKKFVSSSLDAEPKPWKGEKQVCGPGHAQTLFQRFLSTGTLEMEMHPQSAIVVKSPQCCEDGTGAPNGVCAKCEADDRLLTEAVYGQEGIGDEVENKVQAESEVGRQEGPTQADDQPAG